MSSVTNIIITSIDFTYENVKEYFDAYEKKDSSMYFVPVDETLVGGTKSLESRLVIGAFNYVNIEEFISFINGLKNVENLKWDWDFIQIMIKRQDEHVWEIIPASEITNIKRS